MPPETETAERTDALAPEASPARASVGRARPPGRIPLAAPWFRALRPLQWTKNLLLFAGLIFAERYGDAASWIDALVIFVAYCAASSASYLVNDVVDIERDRAHPVKASRPIAAGAIAPRAALVVAGLLLAGALALAAALGWASAGLLVAFVGMQGAYSLWLKHLVIIDVSAIALLFVIRAAAGAVAVDVRLSPWLVLCSGLLALFLALAKRRAELAVAGSDHSARRPALGSYSLPLLDQLITIAAAATISAYSLYTFTATDSSAMMLTIPFVIFGLFRYLQLAYSPARSGEEPERTLASDIPLLATIALWGVSAALILAFD
jgi:4-hydroxybenzoate polyprenyltransferase